MPGTAPISGETKLTVPIAESPGQVGVVSELSPNWSSVQPLSPLEPTAAESAIPCGRTATVFLTVDWTRSKELLDGAGSFTVTEMPVG